MFCGHWRTGDGQALAERISGRCLARYRKPGYASRTELFEDSCEPLRDLPAFSNMATVMTHAELEEKSRHFAAYLQVRWRMGKGSRHPATS
jgi:hypothetical protein